VIRTSIDNWYYDSEQPKKETDFESIKLILFKNARIAQAKHEAWLTELSNSCPKCFMIRSDYEIENGMCMNCD